MSVELERRSPLCGALRRAGGALGDVVDVLGNYVPDGFGQGGDRVYGALQSHDASVRVGFDAKKVPLPRRSGVMQASGKLWLDEQSGIVTLMVRRYRFMSV